MARHIIENLPTTTQSSSNDDNDPYIRKQKFNYDCITARENLSPSDVIRQVGKTLKKPITELLSESQVVSASHQKICPSETEINNLTQGTQLTDQIISNVSNLSSLGQLLNTFQTVGGNGLEMAADHIEGKEINVDNKFAIVNQLTAVAKNSAAINQELTQNQEGKNNLQGKEADPIKENFKIAENPIIRNPSAGKYPEVYGLHDVFEYLETLDTAKRVEGNELEVAANQPKANEENPINENLKVAENPSAENPITENIIITQHELVFFPQEILSKLGNEVVLPAEYMATPEQQGVYLITQKKHVEAFYIIKIGYKMYLFVPDDIDNPSLGGIIKSNKKDVRVVRFDERFYIVEEENQPNISYSSCRLKRSPPSGCIKFSDALEKILQSNYEMSTKPEDIKELKPSKTHPGLFSSEEGGLYLEYKNSFFKLEENSDSRADAKFIVTGNKKTGGKPITPACFSRTKGTSYMNTPVENMMESAGMSQQAASSHINSPSKLQNYLIGTGSISKVYDLNNGFVLKVYNGKLDENHTSRLTAGNNNVKGFNRIYGERSGTVSINKNSDGTSYVTASLRKIKGEPLSNIPTIQALNLVIEIGEVIRDTNAAEYLSRNLQRHGIIHNDINKRNIIYNERKFFIIDFDSANFLPEGQTVSEVQTKTMKDKIQYVLMDTLRDIKLRTNTI